MARLGRPLDTALAESNPRRPLLAHHLHIDLSANMALHALFYELDVHNELYHAVRTRQVMPLPLS